MKISDAKAGPKKNVKRYLIEKKLTSEKITLWQYRPEKNQKKSLKPKFAKAIS